MIEAIRTFVAIHLVVLGLSHLLQPKIWLEFFTIMRSHGHVGVFCNGLMHFLMGTLVVAFHPVYELPYLLLTLLGWGWTLKGALYLTAPGLGMKSLERLGPGSESSFRIAGLLLIAVSTVLIAGQVL